MTRTKLFRIEALAAQRANTLGDITLISPPGLRFFSTIAACFVVVALALLVFFTFIPHVALKGILAATPSTFNVVANGDSVVVGSCLYVGAPVQLGEPIFLVSTKSGLNEPHGASKVGHVNNHGRESVHSDRSQVAQTQRCGNLSTQGEGKAHSRNYEIISADRAGIVTYIGAHSGDEVAKGVAVAAIAASGPLLRAYLYLPRELVSDIRQGQALRLTYESYPYQKFGFSNGYVESISTKPECAQVSNTSEHYELLKECSFFKIIVNIPEQEISDGNKAFPLLAGMIVYADINEPRRPVYEWFFPPKRSNARPVNG